ncbi:hypothetical protein A5731_00535 [Mycolicibacterium conceptionense]|uniref:hypothetical protein n=1 Tax=Mycolicibacterium TaxID=1866885 RepID=UPI0007E977B4|nr:hypothetical protein [Mycolicibacterium conceptionense]OBB15487.1 hypothetical protein A5718_29925 [Mycolicibacterium conceptionense]OBF09229.1 hypothetical protein A5731_00535 [Mycolicibacterium conceptionense]OMB98743.1 hypothetical protein A5746_00955 [Mycolicibacterium conceptionense]
MTEPSIAARAEAMQDRLVSYSAQRGSNPKNIPATMHQVLELAGMVRDLAGSERPSVTCAWCPEPARGDAQHNDGRRHPSCGQPDHGQEFRS